MNPHSLRSHNKGLRPGGQVPRKKLITNVTIRKAHKKKYGVRKAYTTAQLLSVRDRFTVFPEDAERVEGVFEGGLGDEIGRRAQRLASTSWVVSQICHR